MCNYYIIYYNYINLLPSYNTKYIYSITFRIYIINKFIGTYIQNIILEYFPYKFISMVKQHARNTKRKKRILCISIYLPIYYNIYCQKSLQKRYPSCNKCKICIHYIVAYINHMTSFKLTITNYLFLKILYYYTYKNIT